MEQSLRTFTRTVLQKSDVPASNYETIIAITEVDPNANMGRHSHPGPEIGYVFQGSGTLSVEGQADMPQKIGQSWKLAPGVAHDFRAGPEGAKLFANWVVEKGKPLA